LVKGNQYELLSVGASTLEYGDSEALAHLMRMANTAPLPTAAGWSEAVTGSGSSAQQPTRLLVATGTTAGSTARLLTSGYGWGRGMVNAVVNWDKKLYILFTWSLGGTDSDTDRWIQIQDGAGTIIGDLDVMGMGVFADNLVLYGESYGSGRAALTLNTTATVDLHYDIAIILYPGSKIEWYVNGVLKATQSTGANIPSGTGVASSWIIASIKNTGSGGQTACFNSLINCRMWQEA